MKKSIYLILWSLTTVLGLQNASGQIISTIAGNGTAGYSGDGGVATAAELYHPECVAIDASGNFYIADYTNNRIRKISAAGIISTIAGNGTAGYAGDRGAATSAELNLPKALAIDGAGNIYISDFGNSRIRKVTPSGIISTVAGNGTTTYSGDGGAATAAGIIGPIGIAIDGSGNIYISDYSNARVRKVNTSGMISTIAGNGTAAYYGDGGPATAGELIGPAGIAIDGSGNIYIADHDNARIRKVNPSGIINTIAGNGTTTYSGDGGAATASGLVGPTGVATDGNGYIYIYNRLWQFPDQESQFIGYYKHYSRQWYPCIWR